MQQRFLLETLRYPSVELGGRHNPSTRIKQGKGIIVEENENGN